VDASTIVARVVFPQPRQRARRFNENVYASYGGDWRRRWRGVTGRIALRPVGRTGEAMVCGRNTRIVKTPAHVASLRNALDFG